MTTAQQEAQAKSRSYAVNASLPGYKGRASGESWGASHNPTPVYVKANVTLFAGRSPEHGGTIRKGQTIRLVSTSNAGFLGMTGLGWRNGQYVHLGSLGHYDVVR